ncbi:ATP-grasp domain-containing protein [Fructobacillus sp. M1-13]|uniref:ATP-grasp domain-containing protein n=1 Tax=Fructobacillus papyriferae TaxID=2713171 RepID=A0ABS5QNC4_9LACO|nr:ATP-grasp domain-containing protein [Fructobacillus papyriferae]MBS9334598.1 ATP-grasp domain-containing protein [Fructobacillus papyriferae]MCD2158587.1 ATP-grasp domain-containing protein [Fructobacillus papyriferae]
MNVVILAPIGNRYIDYFTVVKDHPDHHYCLFILEKHRDNYPESLPDNIELIVLKDWVRTYIAYEIGLFHQRYPIDLLFAYTEEEILFAAEMRERYQIKGQKTENALRFRHKNRMMDFVQQNGFDVPSFDLVHSVEELKEAIERITYPVIVKPGDGMGSQRTYRLNHASDLQQYIRENNIQNILVSRFIDWPVYHLDGLMKQGEILAFSPSRYFHNTLDYQHNQSIGSIQVEENSPAYHHLLDYSQSLLPLFNQEETLIFHLEVFFKKGKIYFLEVACRMGGGRIERELYQTYGVHFIQELLAQELGEKQRMSYRKINPLTKGFVLVAPKEGLIRQLPAQSIEKLPFENVYDFYLFRKEGSQSKKAASSIDAIASISVEGQSFEKVLKELKEIDRWYREKMIYE